MIQIPTLNPVESSCISTVGYENDDLFVQYKSGFIYVYKNVPEKIYKEMLAAPSMGKFVNAVVKPNFDYDFLR